MYFDEIDWFKNKKCELESGRTAEVCNREVGVAFEENQVSFRKTIKDTIPNSNIDWIETRNEVWKREGPREEAIEKSRMRLR